jgi:hypothetical protein
VPAPIEAFRVTASSTQLASAEFLEVAVDNIGVAATAVQILADGEQARRLNRLATEIEHEAEYLRNRGLGYPPVRRRTDAPAGAALGWWLRYDAITRASRSELGLPGDYLPLDGEAAA